MHPVCLLSWLPTAREPRGGGGPPHLQRYASNTALPWLPNCRCAAATINQRLKEADLSADDAAVLEEEPLLKAALEAAEAAEAAQGGAAQPAATQAAWAGEEEEAVAAVAGSSVELVSCCGGVGVGQAGGVCAARLMIRGRRRNCIVRLVLSLPLPTPAHQLCRAAGGRG